MVMIMNLEESLNKCEKGKQRKKAADLIFLKKNKEKIIFAYEKTKSPKNIFTILFEYDNTLDYEVFRRWLYRNINKKNTLECKNRPAISRQNQATNTHRENKEKIDQDEKVRSISPVQNKSKFTQTYNGDDI